MFFMQFVDRVEIQRLQWIRFNIDWFFIFCNMVIIIIVFGYMVFCFVILWCVIWVSYMVVAAVNVYIFIDYNKIIFMFMYCIVWVDFSISWIFVVVI